MTRRPLWLTIPLLLLGAVVMLWTRCNADDKPVPPTIPAEIELAYWRADKFAATAAQVAEEEKAKLQAATAAVIKACGPTHQPQEHFDAQGKRVGRFVCAPVPLAWTGHDNEYVAKRGPTIVAMIVKGADGWALYDQRGSETPERPGKLALLADSLEKAKEGAKGW